MRIVMVASECEPFAKTGGLADVVDALSRALGSSAPGGLGHDVDVFLPWYRGLEPPTALASTRVRVPVGPGAGDDGSDTTEVVLHSGAADGYRLRLVEHAPSYDRHGLYLDAAGDYADNPARFTLLGRAALEAIVAEEEPVDVIHGHDWQAGPLLLSIRHRYPRVPSIERAATVLTCHNLAYHGWTPPASVGQLDLPAGVVGDDGVDLLRSAIETADLVNTVSPTYARESLVPGGGGGVEDALALKRERYVGILNGIDTELWDPATDAALAAPYDVDDLAPKAATKASLCERHGLDPDGPLLGVIGRLDPQKGFDLVAEAAPALVAAGARLIVLGTGNHELVAGLVALARRHADRIVVLDRFDRDEARRIYAGSDLFLMPSRFEPCGQGQLISMRYGTPPVVRATGGLVDTVVDADADPEQGTGFVFEPAEADALVEAVGRAMAAWADADRFAAIVSRGMRADPSWREPARRYEAAYREVIGSRGPVRTARDRASGR